MTPPCKPPQFMCNPRVDCRHRVMTPSASRANARCVVVLTSPPFAIAVGLLLLNDSLLKAAVGNWVTGKLADFAGLAAFSMFFAAMRPAHRRAAFIVTGIAFVLWKSPLSDGALEAWNALGVWPLARVKDYSDLLALGVLVPTYRLVQRMDEKRSARPGPHARRVGALATGITAVIAFTATSVYHPMPIEEVAYSMSGTRDEVIAGLDSARIPMSDRPKKRPSSKAADTLVVHIRQPPERWLAVTIEVRDAGPGESQIRPIALGPHGPPPTTEAMRRAFIAQVIQPLREWLFVR